MMRRTAWLSLLLVPFPAWAQQTVTKAELRSQSQRTTERQLKDQLWSIFTPVDERRRKGQPAPRAALASSWLTSRSYATPVPGLCRVDTVTLHFAPASDAARTAETPVRAYGVEASAQFHFRTPPGGWATDIADYERSPWHRECAGLGLDKQDFFSAPDEGTATDAYYAMLLAKRASAAGAVQPDCRHMAAFEKRPCVQVVAELAANGVSDVAECERPYPLNCYRISDREGVQMEVVVAPKDLVQSITLEGLIVTGDTLID